MSEKWPGGVISSTPVTPSGPYQDSTASGVWSLEEAAYWKQQGSWPTAGSTATYVEDVFGTYLYTGTGSAQTITNNINISGNGGLVWTKTRNSASKHLLNDTARGASKALDTAITSNEDTYTDGITSFNSDGYSLGVNTNYNTNGNRYVSWTFREQPKFFDIVTYSGNGTAGREISHNLGSTPGCIIIKARTGSTEWVVWHRGLSSGYRIVLNTTAAETNSGAKDYFGNGTIAVDPTSTVFTVGSLIAVNKNGENYVAYLFAHDAGGFGLSGNDSVIACGSYTGNGSSTAGPTVTLGWEPQFILIKAATEVADWYMVDNIRGINNSSNGTPYISPNTSSVEAAGSLIKLNATGFTLTTASVGLNTNTVNYIYIAIRRGPMKVPTDATKVFQPVTYTGTNVDNRLVNTGIVTDMTMARIRTATSTGGFYVASRLTTNGSLGTAITSTENTDADSFMTPTLNYGNSFSAMNGFGVGNDATRQLNQSSTSQLAHAWQRAPRFFDVVTYTGTGTATTQNHNLGAVPELMLIKNRSSAQNWAVYHSLFGANAAMSINDPSAAAYGSTFWNSTAPTSTVFSVGTDAQVNGTSTNLIAYLFASCPGVSKVGFYFGNGTSTNQIDCGFTSGSRYVLIKRTDNTAGWYVWDSARGIVAGNDPYLLLNSTAAEVTSTDRIDTYNAGFEVSTTNTDLNEQFGTTWVSQTSGTSDSIDCFLYNNGQFFAVGASGQLLTSPDGFTWTLKPAVIGFGSTLASGIAYGAGAYVVVGASGKLSTSTDGLIWTLRTSAFGTTNINNVAFGNGIFVAVGGSGKLSTSNDSGVTWTLQTSSFGTTAIQGVTYGNGIFVAVGSSGKLATSSDGVNWTQQTSSFSTSIIYNVIYDNGLFVAVGQSGKIATSTNGVTWTQRTSGVASDLIAVAYGGGVYMAAGNSGVLLTSPDGTTWTSRTSSFGTTGILSLGFGNNVMVAGGESGTLANCSTRYIYLAIA